MSTKKTPEKIDKTAVWGRIKAMADKASEPKTPEPVTERSFEEVIESSRQHLMSSWQHKDQKIRQKSEKIAGDSARCSGIRMHDDWLFPTQTLQFLIEERKNPCDAYVLLGQTGTGKTLSSVAFVAELSYYMASRLMTAYKLADAISKRDYSVQDKARSAYWLILDDLGAEPGRYKGSDFSFFLDSLLDERYQKRLKTIITSNMTGNQFQEKYGDRIISRIMQTGKVFEATDGDMRRQTAI